jgi:hypothetical protein
VSCPRCRNAISDGFYCIRCGYVPTYAEPITEQIEQNTDTSISTREHCINNAGDVCADVEARI